MTDADDELARLIGPPSQEHEEFMQQLGNRLTFNQYQPPAEGTISTILPNSAGCEMVIFSVPEELILSEVTVDTVKVTRAPILGWMTVATLVGHYAKFRDREKPYPPAHFPDHYRVHANPIVLVSWHATELAFVYHPATGMLSHQDHDEAFSTWEAAKTYWLERVREMYPNDKGEFVE
jgi:hypothetical protein